MGEFRETVGTNRDPWERHTLETTGSLVGSQWSRRETGSPNGRGLGGSGWDRSSGTAPARVFSDPTAPSSSTPSAGPLSRSLQRSLLPGLHRVVPSVALHLEPRGTPTLWGPLRPLNPRPVSSLWEERRWCSDDKQSCE